MLNSKCKNCASFNNDCTGMKSYFSNCIYYKEKDINMPAMQWAKEQINNLKFIATGYGWEAIMAQVKLKKIKILSNDELEEAAIIGYKTHVLGQEAI
jgi:formylmethanofuran:tetrahydromethanopterin formyltransferase